MKNILQKEIELICALYENDKLKISEIAKKFKISVNTVKRLIDALSRKYSFNIAFDKKEKTYYLLQKEIEKNSFNIQFWWFLLMIIFYYFSKSENAKIKNLGVLLLSNFFKFFKQNLENYVGITKFFDEDLLFLLNDVSLNYIKKMDYTLFIKIKTAIINKNEIRITMVDKIDMGFKRINLFPLHLAFLRNNWYLIGFTENNYIVIEVDDIREVFFTGRIWEGEFEVSVEDAIPELKEYIALSRKYQVQLDISDYVGVYGIGFLHPSQKIIKKENKIVLQLEIANLNVLFRWLSSHGKLIKIIEPEIVKQKYIEYLLSIIDSYN